MPDHAALNELSESSLRALTCADQRGRVALVLTATEHRTERIVGEACYAVSSDGETAEFAIAVADALRGQGLAERLLTALIDKARAAGFRWLVGEVLAGNARMRCRSSPPPTTRPRGSCSAMAPSSRSTLATGYAGSHV